MRGNWTPTGSWGEVWVDGEKMFVLQKIEQKVEVNRGGVQVGIDVDSRMTGLKGSGTLSIKKVYSRVRTVLEKLGVGQGVRCRIIIELEDPDAADGQIERQNTDNVQWNIVLVTSQEAGGQIQEGQEFGFALSGMKNLDGIKQDGGVGK